MENVQIKTVDEYISIFLPEIQKIMNDIRQTIRKAAPEAKELIAYRMPAYKMNEQYLVFFAAFKKHIGFYPLPTSIDAFKSDLAKYKHAKGSVQFPIGESMPLELIERMVKFRVQEILDEKE